MTYVPKNNLAENLKSIFGVDSSIPSVTTTNKKISPPVNNNSFSRSNSFSNFPATSWKPTDNSKKDDSKDTLSMTNSLNSSFSTTPINSKNNQFSYPNHDQNKTESNHNNFNTNDKNVLNSCNSSKENFHVNLPSLHKDPQQLQTSLESLIQQKNQINESICQIICDQIFSEPGFPVLKEQRKQILLEIDKIKKELHGSKYTTANSHQVLPKSNNLSMSASSLPNGQSTVFQGNFKNNSESFSSSNFSRSNSFVPSTAIDLLGETETIDLDEFSSDEETISKSPNKIFPWSNDVYRELNRVFKLETFRYNQLEAINSTLAGEDVFVLMPTGGGKSLCYQLPAIIKTGKTQGLTIVVSPLLSLVQDQVSRLLERGILTVTINGESTAAQRKFFFDELSLPTIRVNLAYLTPELLMNSEATQNIIKKLYERKQLARFVIDEAHCVSQWGHDFRKDYKEVGSLKKQYPDIPFLALTATANSKVKLDIIQNLNIRGCKVISQSFNRTNLYYEVRPKNSKTLIDDINAFIHSRFPNQTGIIYNSSRAKCEETAQALISKYRLKAAFYHAGLAPADRREIQEKFLRGSLQVIVATIAFGMGIDKANVRYVIHCCFPSSLEGYYQETGRAGRDGLPATCVLYYSYKDKSFHDFMIDKSEGNYASKERLRSNVRRVLQYCENKVDCRRQQVLAYFDENFDKSLCNLSCDNCHRCHSDSYSKEDFTELAKNAVRLLKKIQDDKVTLLQLLDIFRGSSIAKYQKFNTPEIPEFGAGSKQPRIVVERLFHQLIILGILFDNPELTSSGFPTSYLRVSPSHLELLNGKLKVFIDMPSKEKSISIPNKRSISTHPNNVACTPDAPRSRLRRKTVPHHSTEPLSLPNAPQSNKVNSPAINSILDACYQQLKALRSSITSSERIQVFKVFSDTALVKMIEKLPENRDDLMEIETVTALSAKKYGPQFLTLIANAKKRINSISSQVDLTNSSAPACEYSTNNTSHYFTNSSFQRSALPVQNVVPTQRQPSCNANQTNGKLIPIDIDIDDFFESDD